MAQRLDRESKPRRSTSILGCLVSIGGSCSDFTLVRKCSAKRMWAEPTSAAKAVNLVPREHCSDVGKARAPSTLPGEVFTNLEIELRRNREHQGQTAAPSCSRSSLIPLAPEEGLYITSSKLY